jgi:hypothetical protein
MVEDFGLAETPNIRNLYGTMYWTYLELCQFEDIKPD